MIHRLTIDAFPASPLGAAALGGLAEDSTLAHSRVRIEDGGLNAALARYGAEHTPQIILVEAEEDGDALLSRLDRLADVCEATTRVIVLGAHNDIHLYRTLLARGISEYLPLPATQPEVIAAIATLFTDPQATPKGKVIAFWGVRGGAGASTLAQNTAYCLGQQLREPVLYLDMDVAFGTSGLAFDLEARQGIAEILAHPDRMDPVMLERCLAEVDAHLRVLASPGDPRIAARMDVDGIDRLLDMAAQLGAAVVVDLPHVWTDWTAHVLFSAAEVALVSAPDLASLRDCKSMLEILGQRRGPTRAPKLVLNRVESGRHTQLGSKAFTDTLAQAPALSIALDTAVFGEAANSGRMLPEAAPISAATRSLRELAALLAGKPMPVERILWHRNLVHWLKG